jgi:PKD repeat protein
MAISQDDPTAVAPTGEDDGSYEETEPSESYVTTQTIGDAPGMDEYRWFNQDFGWTHTFDACCKEIKNVKLRLRAWDVDVAGGEVDKVYADGVYLGDLEGAGSDWSITDFDIDQALLADGVLNIWVDIDATNEQTWWAVTIDWSRLRVRWDWLPPVADFSAKPLIGVSPMTVKFTNLSTCAVAWKWDFGDGSEISTEKNPIHTYRTEIDPKYTITLTAYNPNGVTDQMVKVEYITCYPPIVPDFDTEVNIGVGELMVNFTNLTTGGATDYIWEFGDGGRVSDLLDPGRLFKIGSYDISLSAWGHPVQGVQVLTQDDFVVVYDPKNAPADLKIVECSASYKDEPWANAIDKDFWYWNGTATISDKQPAFCKFKFADTLIHTIDKIRLLVDTGVDFQARWLRDFKLLTSIDCTQYDTVKFADTLATGRWTTYVFEKPVKAKCVRLDLLSPTDHDWIQIGEFEVWEAEKTPPAIQVAKHPAEKPVEVVEATTPTDFVLSQNYPNPFNPETDISYQIPEAIHVTVKIFNMRGEEVRSLVDELKNAGVHTVTWDGLDNLGNKVSSGVYVYRLDAGRFNCTRKMAMLK